MILLFETGDLLLCHLPDQCPILNLLIDLDSVRRSDFRMAAWLP